MALVIVLVVLGLLVVGTLVGVLLVGAVTAPRPHDARPGEDGHPLWLMEGRDGDDAVYLMEDGHRIRVRPENSNKS
jgi:hypothetical protein